MAANTDFRDFFTLLRSEEVEYMVVGEFAFYYYLEPRFTKTLEVWINTSEENAKKTCIVLREFGIPLLPQQVEDFTKPELGYQIGIRDVRIKILGHMAGLSFSDAYPRAESTHYAGVPIKIISKQDLIASKKATLRQKDLLDAELLERSSR